MTEDRFTLKVNKTWNTPATKYPTQTVGSASIVRTKQPRGYYRMEAVDGYIFYQCMNPIPLTALIIDGKTTMVDDPLHWLGMKALARHSVGKVYVAGLGLGLIVHALATNPKVTHIHVVEINADVGALVYPLLPKGNNIKVFHGNALQKCDRPNISDYDTIILDLWVKGHDDPPEDNPFPSMAKAIKWAFSNIKADASVWVWGIGDHRLNPSIDPEVRAKLPKNYGME